MNNGIISITKEKKVVFKCVAGSNGQVIKTVVEEIKKHPFEDLNPKLLYQLCIDMNFGCKDDLVIQSTDENFPLIDEDLSYLYNDKEKFNNPKFNPRWELGTADYTKVIKY